MERNQSVRLVLKSISILLLTVLLVIPIRTNAADTKKVTIRLSKTTGTLYVKQTLKLNARVVGSSGKVTWKSGNSKIAAVDKSGKVTAKKAGSVTITAKVKGKTASCRIKVINPLLLIS